MRPLVLWLLNFLPHRTIMRGEEPYLSRYYLLGGPRTDKNGKAKRHWLPFNLFLHCFHASDEPPAHNHPWGWARSLILKGAYRESRLVGRLQCGTEVTIHHTYHPGDINAIGHDTFHYVTLLTPEVWSLFLVGRNVSGWGFITPEGEVDEVKWTT